MRAAVVMLALVAPSVALAQAPALVRVTEVVGGRAYLVPGENAGVGKGTVVVIRGKRFVVKSASSAFAVVEIGDATVREGDRGQAAATATAGGKTAARETPVPLERFAGVWTEPRWPSAAQKPRPVPLGGVAGGAVQLELIGQSMLYVPKDANVAGHVAVEARLSAEPWRDRPFGVDADALATYYLEANVGPVTEAEPNATVRELRLRYGPAVDPFAALGRLRWAARSVGMLDGIRLRTPSFAGGFTLAGFGGFVPNVVTDAPATDAARFGAELAWDRPGAHADVVAYGSTFGGSVDERRLAVTLDATPGPFILDARAELGLFDADNPWGLSTLELMGAGAGAGVRAGPWRLDLRFDLRQPERSRWLASLLPQSYLCPAQPAGTACDTGLKLRLAGTATAGYESTRLVVTAGGTAVGGDGDATESSVFADVRLLGLLGAGRLGVGGAVTQGSFLDQRTLRVEVGAALARGAVDLDLYWRGSILDYTAATSSYWEHRVGLDAALSAGPRTDLVFTVEGMTGAEVDALTFLATAVWRPLP